jgi:hypothetical protein
MLIANQRSWIAAFAAILVLGLGACAPLSQTAGAAGVPASVFSSSATATPRAGLGSAAAEAGQSAVSTPSASTTQAAPPPTAWATPNAPLRTSQGRVTKVEPLAGGGVRLVLTPTLSSMRADFVLTDWSHVTALYYWAGLQTPTPVADDERRAVIQGALNHQVTIGYYDTNPPTIVLVSVHKQAGDPQ